MKNIRKKEVGSLDYDLGKHAIRGIKFRYAARELGVTAWGMNVRELEPGCMDCLEHDHRKDDQEEAYVALKGNGVLRSSNEQWVLGLGDLIRVGPKEERKINPGTNRTTVLAIGATPGEAYKVRQM
jgi:uncharacterized cupin superfamily protein